jgi:precorrin-6B methylase 2
MLPDDMTGKTFLDVGCGSGKYMDIASKKNSKYILGVDIARHQRLPDKFNFEQLDITSPHFTSSLPMFNIVLCKGTSAYIDRIVPALCNLRSVTTDKLIIDTYILKSRGAYKTALHTPQVIRKLLTDFRPNTLIEADGKSNRHCYIFCATFN